MPHLKEDEHLRTVQELIGQFKNFRENLSPAQRRVLLQLIKIRRGIYPPEDGIFPLQVIYPAVWPFGTQDYRVDSLKRIAITIEFDELVDIKSIKPKLTCILTTSLDANADGAITKANPTHGGGSAITFTSDKSYEDLLFFGPDAVFSLTLLGTNRGNGVVLSKSGSPLDGDSDGMPGGDFTAAFTWVG